MTIRWKDHLQSLIRPTSRGSSSSHEVDILQLLLLSYPFQTTFLFVQGAEDSDATLQLLGLGSTQRLGLRRLQQRDHVFEKYHAAITHDDLVQRNPAVLLYLYYPFIISKYKERIPFIVLRNNSRQNGIITAITTFARIRVQEKEWGERPTADTQELSHIRKNEEKTEITCCEVHSLKFRLDASPRNELAGNKKES
ncbi:hypothetical protein QOT17_015220 [Balamuthia mandrillaris]